MHLPRWISQALAGVLIASTGVAATLGAQTSTTRRHHAPSLDDTVGVLLAIAERGDVNLRRAPRLVPATSCLEAHVSCRAIGWWGADTARTRALLDSVRALMAAHDAVAADSKDADSVLFQGLALTAPIFYGSTGDSARIEVGVRARLHTGRRGYFESDAHVTLARGPVTRHWSLVQWFTRRIT